MVSSLVPSHSEFIEFDELKLAKGGRLAPYKLAYQTYGKLSPKKDNAVLVFHAMTGSQNAAGYNETLEGSDLWNEECRLGWWDGYIGAGRAFDTDRLFVICANYIGGCYGSTGPNCINPDTGKHFGGDFPTIEVSDIVDSQIPLLDHFGIDKLLLVTGGSMGGFCTTDFAVRYPDRVHAVVPIASGIQVTALNKVLNFEQIYAIEEDPNFNNGFYYEGQPPAKGLALARMIAHKTFVSLNMMESRAKQHIIQSDEDLSGYNLQHQIESYVLYQGKKFVERYDANSYLRILGAWQNFNIIESAGGGSIKKTFENCKNQQWLIFTIDSDVCFYPGSQATMAEALKDIGVPHQHVTVHSDKGHDSFLLEPYRFTPHLQFYINEMLSNS